MQRSHDGILQKAGRSFKSDGPVSSVMRRSIYDMRQVGRRLEQLFAEAILCQEGRERDSVMTGGGGPLPAYRGVSEVATVKRMVPMRLTSLTCSPAWISTLYRPGVHRPWGEAILR